MSMSMSMSIKMREVGPNENHCPDILYAIREVDTGKIIWNARGSAYKHLEHVTNKLEKLHKKNPDKVYSVICWLRQDYEPSVYFMS